MKKYTWIYEYNLWKQFSVFITVFKVMLFCGMLPVLLVLALMLVEGDKDVAATALKMIAFMTVITSILTVLGYIITAFLKGGKYCVMFEMDDNGINHIEMEKSMKKNRLVSILGIGAGIILSSPTVAGASIMAYTKRNMYSEFSKVRKIKGVKKRNTIYIEGDSGFNQVYVDKENFDYCLEYIIDKCKKARIKIK